MRLFLCQQMDDWLSVSLMHRRLCLILPCVHLPVFILTNVRLFQYDTLHIVG